MLNEYGEYISPFGDHRLAPLRYVGDPFPAPKHEWRTDHLYSTKQTPRGSVVVLGDRIISEHEMPTAIAQQQADWLNHRKSACPVTSL